MFVRSKQFFVNPTLLRAVSAIAWTMPSPGLGTMRILRDMAAPTPVPDRGRESMREMENFRRYAAAGSAPALRIQVGDDCGKYVEKSGKYQTERNLEEIHKKDKFPVRFSGISQHTLRFFDVIPVSDKVEYDFD